VWFVDLGGDNAGISGNIQTVPYVADEKVLAKYYSAADVLLYPTLADNCPLVVLEAQACGLPVVSFNTGGVPELVEHQKTGYIAEYENTQDLISGLRWVISRPPGEIYSIRAIARTRVVSNFTSDHMADQYLDLYRSLVTIK
jgi:glycosyltransferase involved in cell wall biosynthesis